MNGIHADVLKPKAEFSRRSVLSARTIDLRFYQRSSYSSAVTTKVIRLRLETGMNGIHADVLKPGKDFRIKVPSAFIPFICGYKKVIRFTAELH